MVAARRLQSVLDVVFDSLDDHDGVVNHDADRQHQSEEGQVVEREAHGEHDREGADDPHRDGHERDDRRSPILQEDQHDQGDQDHRIHQGHEDFLDRFADEGRGIVADHVIDAAGKVFFELLDLRLDEVCRSQGVGVGQLEDGHVGDGLAVDLAAHILILRPQLDMADVFDPDDPAVRRGFDDDLRELLGIDQAAQCAQGDLGLLAGQDGGLADLAGGDLEVLFAQGADHVAGGHVADGQLVGIEPDPHAVIALAEHQHVADARQPRQLGLKVDECVIAER